jgi:hypothetical protein
VNTANSRLNLAGKIKDSAKTITGERLGASVKDLKESLKTTSIALLCKTL